MNRATTLVVVQALLLLAAGAARADAEIIAEGDEPLIPGAKLAMKNWEIERITDDVYAFRYSFYRNIFVVTPDGVIATDPLNAEAGRILAEQLKKITDKPVKYVAYSHSHFDHAAGGRPFKEQGATFVAQEQCAANLRENTTPEMVMPDITFSDRYRIDLGGKSLELFYFGPAHDNCLSVILVRPAQLLFMVDMGNLPTGWSMFYNPAVSEDRVWNMVRWHRAVEDLIAREGIRTVIGAHMNVGRDEKGHMALIRATTGPATTVRERRMFWEGIIEATRSELARGTPAERVPGVLVERKVLADQIVGYDAAKMRILYQRMVAYLQTGE